MAITSTRELGHWIAGAPSAGEGRRLDVVDPASGETVAQVAVATDAEIDATVEAAAAAAEEWGRTSLARRARAVRVSRARRRASRGARRVDLPRARQGDNGRGRRAGAGARRDRVCMRRATPPPRRGDEPGRDRRRRA